MFDQDCAFRPGDPRTTERVYPDEVHDTEEVHKERETCDEPYDAIRGWGFDVRGEVSVKTIRIYHG